MNKAVDTQTIDLVDFIESQPCIDAEQNACACVNSADWAALHQQARDYAHQIAQQAIKDGFEPKALHCYTDAAGTPLYWKTRAKHDDGRKWIRAISKCEKGWQMKEPDFKTVYPAGNGKKPLYRLHELSAATHDQPIWLFEGEQKADLAMSLGLIASTCGGSSSIDSTHLEPLRGRVVVIWADHDDAGTKARDALIAALQAIDCNVSYVDVDALGLPHKGDIVDWVDLRAQDGIDTTAADIQALAVIVAPSPATGESLVLSGSSDVDKTLSDSNKTLNEDKNRIPKGHLCEPMAYGGNDARFEITPNGIFYISKDQHDNERAHFIASPILVIAKTRDSNNNAWGRLLQWHDDENHLHQWAMPMQLLQGDGSDVRRELADQGAMISPEKRSRDLLMTYLGSYPVDRFALCVDRLGWHGSRYVLPKNTYGEQDNALTVFQNSNALSASFNQSGTLQDWQEHLAKPCAAHNRLVFALSCAFAGQLLEPIKEQGGGFHLRGNSSSGKSTALKIAGSVWGNPEQVIHEWRATGNALESIAALHNDSFLGLDEINQCDPRDIGNTVYMLANGQGKARMQRTGGNRPTAQWRILFLSAGEQSLASVIAPTGKRTNAGQEIRLADIPADAGHGLGIFDRLTLSDDPAKQSDLIKQAAMQYHGTAGQAWIAHITQDKTKLAQQAQQLIDDFMQKYASNGTGQTSRVAKRCAIVAAAGEIATQAGITGWQQGCAFAAVGQCFNDWLEGFGQGGNHEERTILAEVKAFFEANGASRFENLQADPDRPERIHSRVGYFKHDGEQKTYLVYPEQFKTELCKGRDYRQVAKALKAAGWLDCANDKNTKLVRNIEGNKNAIPMYVFNGAMLNWNSEQSQIHPKTQVTTGYTGYNLQPQGFDPVTCSQNAQVTQATVQVTDNTTATRDGACKPCNLLENTTGYTDKGNNINIVTCVDPVTNEKQPIQDQPDLFTASEVKL